MWLRNESGYVLFVDLPWPEANANFMFYERVETSQSHLDVLDSAARPTASTACTV